MREKYQVTIEGEIKVSKATTIASARSDSDLFFMETSYLSRRGTCKVASFHRGPEVQEEMFDVTKYKSN